MEIIEGLEIPTNFFLPFGQSKIFLNIMPRDEACLDRIILNWHKSFDLICQPRRYKKTPEQSAVIEQIASSIKSSASNLFSEAFDAMDRAIEKDSDEAKELFDKEDNNLERLYQELERLEPADEEKEYLDCTNEEEYLESFSRELKPGTIFAEADELYNPKFIILLDRYEQFSGQSTRQNYWAVKLKKNKLHLTNTRKPHKHNKPMVAVNSAMP